MKSIYSLDPLEFERLQTEPLARRPSKVTPKDFARPYPAKRDGAKFADFIETLPQILAGAEFRRLVEALLQARRKKKPILWGLGGHVIKVGLVPVLIDLLERGFVSGIATTGAALIHDFEIALAGRTSEDVEAQLARGRFGLAEETGALLNKIARFAAREELGLGEAVGKFLAQSQTSSPSPPKPAGRRRVARMQPIETAAPFAHVSLLVAAYRARVPFTVHLALGTDIFHIHPGADGAALGASSFRDFRLFCALVQRLHNGGVYLNMGSAVILPEVFLKALAAIRGRGQPLRNFTTANLDFQQHYRPMQNVLLRPARALRAQAIALTAPHELLLPLLAAALIERS